MRGRSGRGKGFHLAAICLPIGRLINHRAASRYRSAFRDFECLPNRVHCGKFAANEKIVLHCHIAALHTLVAKGEHRVYTPEGELKEVRPAGTYKARKANPEPHTEGGGDSDVFILFRPATLLRKPHLRDPG